MPGRKYTLANSTYRYGFNGKENDKDISEGGQDYGMRIYDARLGRFLSVDPLTEKYPELTPYQFASNTPIQAIDLDGKEAFFIILQGEVMGLFLGSEISGGIAFDKEGFAFIGGGGGKMGIGISATGGVTVGGFLSMDNLEEMGGMGSSTNFSAGVGLKLSYSIPYSNGKFGTAVGGGIGAGAQLSESFTFTGIGKKIKWSDFNNMFPTRPGSDEQNPFPFPINFQALLKPGTEVNTAALAQKALYNIVKPYVFKSINERTKELDKNISSNNKNIAISEHKIKKIKALKRPDMYQQIQQKALQLYVGLLKLGNEALKLEKKNLQEIKVEINKITQD